MPALMALVLCSFFKTICATHPPGPPLPVQSPLQLKLIQKATDRAVVASAAAHAPLLERWNKPSTLEAIRKVCPSLRTANVNRILDRFYEEMRVVEVTHNFAFNQTGPKDYFGDVSIQSLRNASYVYNLWELGQLGFRPKGARHDEDFAEVVILQFPPFPGGKPPGNGTPTTYTQSSQRPIYALMNLLHLDVGNYEFGDVAIVFNRTYVDSLALVAPSDTGNFGDRCLKGQNSRGCHFPYPVDCHKWPNYTTLGTLSNITATMDHIILVNDALWTDLPGCPDTDTANVVRNFQRICYHEHVPVDQPAFDMVTSLTPFKSTHSTIHTYVT